MLYVTALNEKGNLVKASDALKGEKYFCPVCKKELILKKSGNTGEGSRRPHFAHYEVSPNCTPEGVLHFSFKILALERIKYHITNRIPLVIEWMCNKCQKTEKADLLAGAINVALEYPMKDDQYQCRPDLVLVNNANKIYAVIEVVVTHEPEENVVNFYNKHNIAIIQVKVSSEDDLDEIDKKLQFPSSVSACAMPKPQLIPRQIQRAINPMAIDPRVLQYLLGGSGSYGNSSRSHSKPYHGGKPYHPHRKSQKSGSSKWSKR